MSRTGKTRPAPVPVALYSTRSKVPTASYENTQPRPIAVELRSKIRIWVGTFLVNSSKNVESIIWEKAAGVKGVAEQLRERLRRHGLKNKRFRNALEKMNISSAPSSPTSNIYDQITSNKNILNTPIEKSSVER